MIYTLQTFQIDRKDYSEFIRITEASRSAQEQRGERIVGVWTVVLGAPERILSMSCFDSLIQWQKAQDLPQEGGISERLKLVKDTQTIVLRPLTRRQPTEDAQGDNPGIYTLRTYKIERKNIDRLVDLSENHWWHWAERGLRHRPLAQWLSIMAPETRIYMISHYDDLAHWEDTRGRAPEPADPEMRAIWKDGYKAVQERAAMLIDTNVQILRPISSWRP